MAQICSILPLLNTTRLDKPYFIIKIDLAYTLNIIYDVNMFHNTIANSLWAIVYVILPYHIMV